MCYLIRKRVNQIVSKYKTNEPRIILREKQIKILRSPLGGKFAYKTTYKRSSVITLDENLDEYEERYILAHELGHIVLHKGQSTTFYRANNFGNIPKIEREANEFATLLLLHGQMYDNKYDALRENGIPYEMERFI